MATLNFGDITGFKAGACLSMDYDDLLLVFTVNTGSSGLPAAVTMIDQNELLVYSCTV